MATKSGVTKQLIVLPFDHRASFAEKMFDIIGRKPTPEETKKIIEFKKIIYDGFKKSAPKISLAKAAILIDGQFGKEIIADAKKHGYLVCLAVEKSGQKYLSLEGGNNFGADINKYKPAFVKVLIRYNPDDKNAKNKTQLQTLKKLSTFCQKNNYKLMIEALVPPTSQQLKQAKNNIGIYEQKIRPRLAIKTIQDIQQAGIKLAVWKLEGFDNVADCKMVVKQAQKKDKKVGVIILGRGETRAQIEKWLKIGRQVSGVIGFAVGRTIFWAPLLEYKKNEISAKQAAEKISQNYLYFYKIFTKK